MKRYKLLKDLPTFKAGQLAYISKTGNLIAGTPENQETTETGLIIMIYHETTLKKFPNILTEWFEEIEEPTTSVRRTPKMGEAYFYVDEYGNVEREIWDNDGVDNELLAMGFVRLTPEEAAEARDRRLAEVRLRKTSTFEPDFEGRNGGWVVGYNYHLEEFAYVDASYVNYGEPVRYATEEDAKRSIKENRADWLIYLGIKEEE